MLFNYNNIGVCKLFLLLGCLIIANALKAASYYCDPAKGSMLNPGSSTQPWGKLEDVFTAHKTFAPGDVIYLRSGYHGFPVIGGINAEDVVIQAQAGQFPTVKNIKITDARHWVILGLSISPEAAGTYEMGALVTITPTASHITIKQCNIYSTAANISAWTEAEILSRCALGIRVEGRDCIIAQNQIKQVTFGIVVNKTGIGSLVTSNTIDGFIHDGMRGLADSCTFAYNVVKASYAVDDNHDDGFQSWSTDADGKPGAGVIRNVTLRGNTFISQYYPNQPFPQKKSGMQGIGNFDGFFENWVIENNVIITDMWHGISLYGAINCKIVNNTVIKNPLSVNNYTPWIGVYDHKTRGKSSGNVVKNNLVADLNTLSGCMASSNLKITDYEAFFEDYKHYNLHLKPGTAAVGAGSPIDAPLTDMDKRTRKPTVDLGAYQYNKAVSAP